MADTQVYLLVLGVLVVLPAFIACQGTNDYMLDEEEDVLTPIQILKKGLHPANCPAGFRKRDAPKLTSDAGMSESIQPVRKDMMHLLSRLLRTYLDQAQTDQQHDIVVDYMPRRILLGGTQENSRR